jgi:hypothetical protein
MAHTKSTRRLIIRIVGRSLVAKADLTTRLVDVCFRRSCGHRAREIRRQLGDTNDTNLSPRNIPTTRDAPTLLCWVALAIPNRAGIHMRDQAIVLTAVAAVVLTVICYASPHATVTLNLAQTEILAIDFIGSTTVAQQRLAER